MLLEQFHRVPGLDVVREDEYADVSRGLSAARRKRKPFGWVADAAGASRSCGHRVRYETELGQDCHVCPRSSTRPNGASVNNATSLSVHVNAGDHVTCTITNTRKLD